MRCLLVLAASALLGGCAAGGSAAGPRQALADGITLHVAPESFELGGSARVSITTHPVDDGVEAVLRLDDASELKTLYVELAYDAAELHAAAVQGSGLLGDDALELKVLDQQGKLSYGLALPHPDQRDGFSGSGELARVRFARHSPRSAFIDAPSGPDHTESAAEASDVIKDYSQRNIASYDAGSKQLTWHSPLQGDYNQNGEVGLSDLTPLAKYFGESVDRNTEQETAKYVVDGDANGLITQADIAMIAPRFGERLLGFRVFSAPDFSQIYPVLPDTRMPDGVQPVISVPANLAVGDPATQRLIFSADVSSEYGQVLWNEPVYLIGEPRVSQLAVASIADGPLALYDPNYGLASDADSSTLSWYSNFRSDYDCNAEVNESDLQILGACFGNQGPFTLDSREWLCDSYRDGAINTKDLMPLVAFLRARFAGYLVYSTVDETEVPVDPYAPEELEFVAATDAYPHIFSFGKRGRFELELDLVPGSIVWVRPLGYGPFAPEGSAGTRSEVIQVP